MDEDGWTADLAREALPADLVRLGIGDDAAWLAAVPDGWVVATDVLIDGVHGVVADVGAAALAAKAVHVNVSDFAAMGARPRALLVGLVLPRDDTASCLEGVRAGLRAACREHHLALVGGDTNVAEGPLVIAVTMLGTPGPGGLVTRTGARVGDRVSVTGPLGGSLGGRHLAPRSRVEAGEEVTDRLGSVRQDLPPGEDLAHLVQLVRVPRREHQLGARGRAVHDPVACSCTARSSAIPASASPSSSSSEARESGICSAVACTSTRPPSPVMTTLASTSALESSE